jgi:hypothetical protein
MARSARRATVEGLVLVPVVRDDWRTYDQFAVVHGAQLWLVYDGEPDSQGRQPNELGALSKHEGEWGAHMTVRRQGRGVSVGSSTRSGALDVLRNYYWADEEDMRPNASKSVEKVLRAAEGGRYAAAGAFHTAAGIVYSYDLPIGDLRPGLIPDFRILDKKESPSVTTSKHIGYLQRAYPKAQIVRSIEHRGNARARQRVVAMVDYLPYVGSPYATAGTGSEERFFNSQREARGFFDELKRSGTVESAELREAGAGRRGTTRGRFIAGFDTKRGGRQEMIRNQADDATLIGASVAGYLTEKKSGGRGLHLTDWEGSPLGWELHGEVEQYTLVDGDRTTAVVLVSVEGEDVYDEDDEWEDTVYRYAGGYWLAPDSGELFRGEIADGSGDEALAEAKQIAKTESEYWSELDAEAQDEDG